MTYLCLTTIADKKFCSPAAGEDRIGSQVRLAAPSNERVSVRRVPSIVGQRGYVNGSGLFEAKVWHCNTDSNPLLWHSSIGFRCTQTRRRVVPYSSYVQIFTSICIAGIREEDPRLMLIVEVRVVLGNIETMFGLLFNYLSVFSC